ncbi:RT0821/Lpp0805 family surface protein [Arhodomonas aquaeolei]|uniref:RT0821/Lpp0805 family surface protein n=1 Tax=Arhodomonas aquaeolei TaxID=2369 RepID=UPI000363522B|nr:RT0821/Lpp0805 family surface protein [Arhodomonas aquaeolei]MCS4504365.1 RT0821/Lpp0805 family surface protein [Arhodomonas aquaeolei]
MRQRVIGVILAGALGVSGCANYQGTQEQSGMVIGGVLGGLLGSQVERHGHASTAAIIVGTLAGAAIGGSIGRSMDETDRLRTAAALENVRTGVPSSWRNPDTGNEYVVTPTRTYETSGGPCREYTMEASIGGRPETVYGTACRQSDGSWQVQG